MEQGEGRHRRGRRTRTPRAIRYPELTIEKVLDWADAHYRREGEWPRATPGPILDAPREKWLNVDACLRGGFRGLPGGSSLARLLAQLRGVRNEGDLPRLTEAQILAWADAHLCRTGEWPTLLTGPVVDAPSESWHGLSQALSAGFRGLPGGSSLARLLAHERGRRNRKALPAIAEAQILAWADVYHARHGKWPGEDSGPIEDAPGETWMAVTRALAEGLRGLAGGSSLARLMALHRGARNPAAPPRLDEQLVLGWADEHRARTGRWPTYLCGPIEAAPGETWAAVNIALQVGYRGFPGGSSLARLLAEGRGRRNPCALPPLSEEQILRWAEQHRERKGRWPQIRSGPVEHAPGETWSEVNKALRLGKRGLAGGSSLAQLLRARRGARTLKAEPLSVEQIVSWASAHRARTGAWPTRASGPVLEFPDNTWTALDIALRRGLRGLPGGMSLARLAPEHGGRRARA